MNKLSKIFLVIIIILTIVLGIMGYFMYCMNITRKADKDSLERSNQLIHKLADELDEYKLKYYELTGE